ncbi:MAG: SRPBCC domain-containing protein, partial [Acidobacteria bacterium]|nr:SRPBCC domain-containing protein [Acidobacteriota bacterium]
MSIKRDPSGRRSIQAEAEVPGTPEEVWEAIATGPGIGSWFYPTDVDERVGGALRYHTGSEMDHIPAKVTAWD